MTPEFLVSWSAFVLFSLCAVGMMRYWAVSEPGDWMDVSDAGNGWDRLIAVTAAVASAGISFGCLWGLVLWVRY